MKRWQIEEIFSLNDFGKGKLAIPHPHHVSLHNAFRASTKRNSVVARLRRIVSFFLRVL